MVSSMKYDNIMWFSKLVYLIILLSVGVIGKKWNVAYNKSQF
jgi:hypothetical protein